MRTKILYTLSIVLIVVLFISYIYFSFSRNSTPEFKVAFIADQGLSTSSQAVLNLIKTEHADLIIHQGDFDYTDNPLAWDAQTSAILGNTFPQIAVLGNHESKKIAEYRSLISERMKANPEITCVGTLGEQSHCVYGNLQVVSVSPALSKSDAPLFIHNAFATSTDSWRICSWHVNQKIFQVGDKKDEAGFGVYDACRKAGAMIVTGHEHSYERTYLLDDVVAPHIASKSSTLALEPGKTFVVVSGLGGHSIRPQKISEPWWAKVYSATQNATFGSLFCTFNVGGNTKKASCYFKDINNKIQDEFTITR
jgi:hypothetical protein